MFTQALKHTSQIAEQKSDYRYPHVKIGSISIRNVPIFYKSARSVIFIAVETETLTHTHIH